MRNLFLLTFNTLKITFRKKSSIIVYLILPVIIVIFVMNAYSSMDPKIKVGINNKAQNGLISKDFVADLNQQDKFKIQQVNEGDINDFVVEGKVDCVITIPTNFDGDVSNAAMGKNTNNFN